MRVLKKHPFYRWIAMPRRWLVAARHSGNAAPLQWLLRSREETNFTYDLTEANMVELAGTIAAVTGAPIARVQELMAELQNDRALRETVRNRTLSSPYRTVSDPVARYGRRLGWYAVARLVRPRKIVETGIDKGLGSLVLCAALARNAAEGHPGRYYGIDINPEAGWLLAPPYSEFGEIVTSDAVSALKGMGEIDLLLSDSDHSESYEASEYATARMSPQGMILGDNSHVSPALQRFAAAQGLAFRFFREEPKGHWYPGGGIGFCFH
jgi:predicted O-methyltransferase YrrM